MKTLTLTALALSSIVLVACDDTMESASATGTPTPAQQACLAAVSNTTNNGDVSVLRSSFSEAGTEVIVGVGEQRAPWRCIAYSDGSTAGIESITDEGFL